MSATDRVAVVVVHGIADQRPGQTVVEVVRLLCHGRGGAPPYVQGDLHDVLVPVEKLEPGTGGREDASPPVLPAGEAQKPEIARRQPERRAASIRRSSRRRPGPLARIAGSAPHAAPPPAPQPRDLSLALNDYLLGRLVLPEGDALYKCTRVSLRRRADDRAVDVYEMYWADLSRLGTGGCGRSHRCTSCSSI